MEVSVWLGGTTLKSVYGAFCIQDAVQVVWGLWEPHARAGGRLVAGQLTQAGQLLHQCRYQDVVGVFEGGRQSLSWAWNLSCSLLKFWEREEVLLPSCSLWRMRSKCRAEGLERPVYIGLGVGLPIHQAPGQIEGTNYHWLMAYLPMWQAGTPRAAWLI